jgi:hypothetical protein
MTKSVKLVVVIPVGPSAIFDYVLDTIHSVTHYTTPSSQIIVIDDSAANVGANLQSHFPGLIVFQTSGNSGNEGVLYWWLSLAFLYAYQDYEFDVLLKLDTDALIIGERPEDDAIRFFKQNPNVGLIGSYKIDCNGDPRDWSGAARELYTEVSWRRLLRKPRLCMTFRRLLARALVNGYEPGENVQGGASFMSAQCVQRLAEAKLLRRKDLRGSILVEDYIFPLLVRSIGMEIGDFATGHLPMAIRWRGLPCSPHDLIVRKKKVIHSTRFWEDMNEEEIRRFLWEVRSKRI